MSKISFGDPKIRSAWFPTEYQAVLFRVWGMYSAQKLADVLETTPENIRSAWELLGLDPNKEISSEWRRRGYITTIRDTWNILSKEQQCKLLDVTPDEFEIILREDDFLDHKVGIKAEGTECYYRPLTDEETKRTKEIAEYLKNIELKIGDAPDNAFSFVKEYYQPSSPKTVYPTFVGKDMKFIYSYFALYGDPLIDETLDPFPDKLLEEYANYGVNGVWMQGVLYQLVPYPFAPEMSEGWEIRQKNLKKLVDRAAKYGIGVYLYFNEPRWMPDSVFENYPDIKGRSVPEKNMSCLCTSVLQVQEYLENATYSLFKSVEGLAGFFTITRSENPTNCYSHTNEDDCSCPRCSRRSVPEVLAEVNNLLYRGAHRANPNARAIAWVWGWPDDRVEDVISRLDDGIIFQSTSETHIPINKGGVKVGIIDYSMSNPGPGEWAKNNWNIAKKHGHECSAKVQFNNTWEVSGVPYIPVFDLVAQHASNLKKEQIRHMMLSWTLGGAPSPSLSLVSGIFDGKYAADTAVCEMIDEIFPKEVREAVKRSQKIMSEAFVNFPFSCAVVYMAPLTAGPRAVFYPEKTGRKSCMVGIPFDSVETWRGEYPEDIFENQLKLVVEPWRKALEILEDCDCGDKVFKEFRDCAEGCLEHFESVLHLTRFVRARNEMLCGNTTLDGRDAKEVLFKALDDEEANTLRAVRTQSRDSRIGFEASNHYNFSRQNLLEKLINIDYTRRYFQNK